MLIDEPGMLVNDYSENHSPSGFGGPPQQSNVGKRRESLTLGASENLMNQSAGPMQHGGETSAPN